MKFIYKIDINIDDIIIPDVFNISILYNHDSDLGHKVIINAEDSLTEEKVALLRKKRAAVLKCPQGEMIVSVSSVKTKDYPYEMYPYGESTIELFTQHIPPGFDDTKKQSKYKDLLLQSHNKDENRKQALKKLKSISKPKRKIGRD